MGYFIAITDGPNVAVDTPDAGNVTLSYTIENTGDETPDRVFVGFRVTNHSGRETESNAFPFDSLAPGDSAGHTETLGFSKSSNPDAYTMQLSADPSESVGGVSGNGQGDSKSVNFDFPGA